MTLASILTVAASVGYPVLFWLVMAESAGVPVPGETALVSGALLASHHKLQIPLVITVAASAAIIGDNIGYLIGRKGGRWLLERSGPFAKSRRRILETGVPLFERHGPSAVFFGRWVMGLRTWASWLAGATRMPWRPFAVWNAIGGVSWATTIGLAAYLLGSVAKSILPTFGLIGLATAGLTLLLTTVSHRRQPRTPERPPSSEAEADPTQESRHRRGRARHAVTGHRQRLSFTYHPRSRSRHTSLPMTRRGRLPTMPTHPDTKEHQ